MKGTKQYGQKDLSSSQNTQVDVDNMQSNNQWVSLDPKNRFKYNLFLYILFIVMLIILIVQSALYLSEHQKQESRQLELIKKQIKTQQKDIVSLLNLLNQRLEKHQKQQPKQINTLKNQIQKQSENNQLKLNLLKKNIEQQTKSTQQILQHLNNQNKQHNQIITLLKDRSMKYTEKQDMSGKYTTQVNKINRKQIPKRNLKQYPQKDFSEFYCLKKPYIQNKLPPPGGEREFLMNTRYGIQLYGDAFKGKGEDMTNAILKKGTFEPDGINLMGRLLRPGFNMMNLGVHIGLEALITANIVGKQGKLFLFEPSNFTNSLVHKNFELNNFTDRATIFKVALSDKKTKARLYINPSNTGANTLVGDQKKLNPGQYEQVQVDLVDNIIPSDVKIDFALVDVERKEVEVLFGMRNIIERSPYLVIMIEWAYLWNQYKNPTKATQIIQFLLDRDYSFYRYTGFDPVNCTVGTYSKLKNPLTELLKIGFQNLLIAPQSVILP